MRKTLVGIIAGMMAMGSLACDSTEAPAKKASSKHTSGMYICHLDSFDADIVGSEMRLNTSRCVDGEDQPITFSVEKSGALYSAIERASEDDNDIYIDVDPNYVGKRVTVSISPDQITKIRYCQGKCGCEQTVDDEVYNLRPDTD